jgi:hypothetical protein
MNLKRSNNYKLLETEVKILWFLSVSKNRRERKWEITFITPENYCYLNLFLNINNEEKKLATYNVFLSEIIVHPYLVRQKSAHYVWKLQNWEKLWY